MVMIIIITIIICSVYICCLLQTVVLIIVYAIFVVNVLRSYPLLLVFVMVYHYQFIIIVLCFIAVILIIMLMTDDQSFLQSFDTYSSHYERDMSLLLTITYLISPINLWTLTLVSCNVSFCLFRSYALIAINHPGRKRSSMSWANCNLAKNGHYGLFRACQVVEIEDIHRRRWEKWMLDWSTFKRKLASTSGNCKWFLGLHQDGYKHVKNHFERWRNHHKYLVCFVVVCNTCVRVPLKLVYGDMFQYRIWKPQTCIWWPLHPRSMPNCSFVNRSCLLMRNCSNASTPPNDGTHMWATAFI